MFIIQIIFIIYIFLLIYHIRNIQKYNFNGYIIDVKDYLQLKENLRLLNPVVMNSNILNIHFDKLIHKNIEIIHENLSFNLNEIDKLKKILIYKNNKIYHDLKIDHLLSFKFNELPFNELNLIKYKSITILKKNQYLSSKCCFHNFNIIGVIKGSSTFYLFNPKHNEEIKDKSNKQIKKWGHKKIVKENNIIFIPPYWNYIQETKDLSIQINIDIDNIFTFIPNFFKDI
jgi:hypothetical protein